MMMGLHQAQNAEPVKGMGARVAMVFAERAIKALGEIRDLLIRNEVREESHTRMFRAQAAIHQAVALVPQASTKVLEANLGRKGLRIDHVGAENSLVYLGLGQNAQVGTVIPLLPSMASSIGATFWDGKISDALWTGEVYAITLDADSSVVITEIS
jgi:hypothetical protein